MNVKKNRYLLSLCKFFIKRGQVGGKKGAGMGQEKILETPVNTGQGAKGAYFFKLIK